MAFATFYNGSFTDILGQTTTVDIQKDGATDDGDLTFGGHPVVWNAVDDTPDRIYGIKRTSVDIGLVAMDSLFATIRDADIKTYKVVITGRIAGTYWADTRRLRAQIASVSNNVLRCSDGIDLLKTEAWYADEDAAIAAGRVSFVSAFATILAKIGLDLPLRTGCRYYANNTGITTGHDPLAEYDFDVGWLYQKLHKAAGGSDNRPRFVSAYDALWHLLRRWNLKLVQYQGKWLVHHYRYPGDVWFDYTSAGAAADPATATGTLVVTHWSPNFYNLIGDGYRMASGPSYERIESVFDYDLSQDLIRDPMFLSLNNSGDNRWAASAGTTWGLQFGGGGQTGVAQGALVINETSYNSNTTHTLAQAKSDATTDAHYVQSDWSETAVEAQTDNYIELSVGARYIVNATFDTGPGLSWVFYTIEATSENIAGQTGPAGANHFYMQDDNSWSTTPNLLATELTESPYYKSLAVGIGERAALGASLTPGTNYKFRIKLYAAHDTYYKTNSDAESVTAIEWTRPSLLFFEDDADVATETRFVTTNATAIGMDIMDDDVFYIGDGPQASSRSAIVHTASGEATDVWGLNKGWAYPSPGSSAKTIDQLWAEQALASFGSSPRQYDVELVQHKIQASAQYTFHPGSYARTDYIIGSGGGNSVYVTNYRQDAKQLRTKITGYVVENTETGSTTEVTDNNFVYRVYAVQPVNIEAPAIDMTTPVVTTTTADWWFENANTACRSVTYLVTTSSTWSITAGTTKVISKRQAQADQATALTANTLYYVHFKAFSNADGTGTGGAPVTRTFRTLALPASGGTPTSLSCAAVEDTSAMYDFVGSGAVANNALITDIYGSNDATAVISGTSYYSYTDLGLKFDPTGTTFSHHLAPPTSVFPTAVTYIAFINDVGATDSEIWYLLLAEWAGSEWIYIRCEDASPDYARLQIDDLSTATTVDLALNMHEASMVALTVDRSTKAYAFYTMGSGGWRSASGTYIEVIPTTVPDNSFFIFNSIAIRDNQIMYGQFISRVLSDEELRNIYSCVRPVMIGRGVPEAELPKLGTDEVVSSGAFGATITVGTEAANVINVAIQLKDAFGADLENSATVTVFLSDASPPTAINATAPSGGWAIGTDGFFVYEPTAGKVVVVASEADGDIDINITETGVDTWYLNVQLANGKIVTSAAITFA